MRELLEQAARLSICLASSAGRSTPSSPGFPIMSHAIAIDALSYRAGRRFAIRDLNMQVPNGTIYGFLGPNGSSKTTTGACSSGCASQADRSRCSDTMSRATRTSAGTHRVCRATAPLPMLTVSETMRYRSILRALGCGRGRAPAARSSCARNSASGVSKAKRVS